MCECASIKPGSSVVPDMLMTCASAGSLIESRGPTAAILSPSTSTAQPACVASLRASNTRSAVSRYTPVFACEPDVCTGVAAQASVATMETANAIRIFRMDMAPLRSGQNAERTPAAALARPVRPANTPSAVAILVNCNLGRGSHDQGNTGLCGRCSSDRTGLRGRRARVGQIGQARRIPGELRRLSRLPHARLERERRAGAEGHAADRRRHEFPGTVGHHVPAEPAPARADTDGEAMDHQAAFAEVTPGDAVLDVPLSVGQGSHRHVRVHPFARTGGKAGARLGSAWTRCTRTVPEAGIAVSTGGSDRRALGPHRFGSS